jgi:hypothetical protein
MSTLSVATIKSQNTLPPAVQNSSGTEIGTFCRAWVNFNGTGTVAIRASFNVSSITDNGTGDYTTNFTTAMSDANYAPTCSYAQTLNGSAAAARVVYIYSTGATGLRITSKDNAGSATDFESMNVAIFR